MESNKNGNPITRYCVLDTWYKISRPYWKKNTTKKGKTRVQKYWDEAYMSTDCILCEAKYEDKKENNKENRKEEINVFKINPRQNLWHCFKCQMGGDAYSLVMRMNDCSMLDSYQWFEKNKIDILKECTYSNIKKCINKKCVVKVKYNNDKNYMGSSCS